MPTTESRRQNPSKKGPSFKPAQTSLANATEVQSGLYSENPETLTRTLTTLRNQFTIKPNETSVAPSDSRLSLVQEWLGRSAGAKDLYDLWEGTNHTSTISLILGVLSSLLTLLSSHYTFHALGYPIIKNALQPQWTRKLASYIGGSSNELILAALKLFNSMSTFASGRERRAILESFPWELKSLPKLLRMRRKGKGDDNMDILQRPDIRTLYILLLLSFVDINATSQVKTAFLETHRDKFVSFFKGLLQDPYTVIRKVLEVSWAGILSDMKLKRTLKISVFNETTISQLCKLYERSSSEGKESDGSDQVPADLVHHFLLAICTRPGNGICFRDRGWYPRGEEEQEDEDTVKSKGKVYNKMLANVLKTLKVNEDLRQQELVLKILTACPELVAGYWHSTGLTLEPRLSSRWIANISIFGSIISLPVPETTFKMSESAFYPNPPPLSTVIENILPSVNIKSHLSKGLQTSSKGLVQHCTSLALAKCLLKFRQTAQCFRTVMQSLDESETDGQWSKRLNELSREVRKRVPDFQVIVSFAQQHNDVLLAESAMRLLWLYHACLPDLVSEARFDIGKLLVNAFPVGAGDDKDDDEEMADSDSNDGLKNVERLHILRMLTASDQFVWVGKPASSKHSYVHILLKAFIGITDPAVHAELANAINRLFSESIIFQEDPSEPHLWLSCLPSTRRPPPGRKARDGSKLTDEGDSVVVFLDDCIQRCLKTPYRYVEEAGRSQSPLLAAVLEQLKAKLTGKLLSPSDTLALVTFIRKLLFRLSTTHDDLSHLQGVVRRLDEIFHPQNLFPNHPVVSGGIRKDVTLMYVLLGQGEMAPQAENDDVDITSYIMKLEDEATPTRHDERVLRAYEIVDWVRLLRQPLQSQEAKDIAKVVMQLYPPALREFVASLEPSMNVVWDIARELPDSVVHLESDWLLIHTHKQHLADKDCRDILTSLLVPEAAHVESLKRAVRLVSRSLDHSQAGPIVLLSGIMQRVSDLWSSNVVELKEFIFCQCRSLSEVFMHGALPTETHTAIQELVSTSLDPSSEEDRTLLLDVCQHWHNVVRVWLQTKLGIPMTTATIWLRFLPMQDILGLFALLELRMRTDRAIPVKDLLDNLLDALHRWITTAVNETKPEVLQLLLRLRQYAPESAKLEESVAMVLSTAVPFCVDGRVPGSSTLHHVDGAWTRQLQFVSSQFDFLSTLQQSSWTDSTANIISFILSTQPAAHEVFSSWLRSAQWRKHSLAHFSTVMRAFLDIQASSIDEVPTSSDMESLADIYDILLAGSLDLELSEESRVFCADCLCYFWNTSPKHHETWQEHTLKPLQTAQGLTAEFLCFVSNLSGDSSPARLVREGTTKHAFRWGVDAITSGSSSQRVRAIKRLKDLLKEETSGISQLAEPLLIAIIQFNFTEPSAFELLSIIIEKASLKPLFVNRYLQSILQHSLFFKVCAPVHGKSELREACINALHVLFHLHPNNTCQITHVEPLVALYRGLTSPADAMLLRIFRLFEEHRRTSIASLLSLWSATDVPCTSSLEAIKSLDSLLVLQTCTRFPLSSYVDKPVLYTDSERSSVVYDPVFLLFLLAHALATNPPDSALAWVELLRSNIVSLAIRCLSARDERLRELALSQLAVLWNHLEATEMLEQPHVLHLLGLLRDVLRETEGSAPPRLPCYTTLFFSHALRAIFYPSHFVYPLTARFLLQRPSFDTNDLPMLFSMLYSSEDNWKKERTWILRFIADGMTSSSDWKVLKRRHTWDLLSSMFQSTTNDQHLRRGVLEILASLTCVQQAITSLVIRSSLLNWIEMQLFEPKPSEVDSWLKILENIIVTVDPLKLESATSGEWRSVIARCLVLLIRSQQSWTPASLHLFARTTLRLSHLEGTVPNAILLAVDQAVDRLKALETRLDVRAAVENRSPLPYPPHKADTIHTIHDEPLLEAWSASIDALWRSCMRCDEKTPSWDFLTSRLLISRAIHGRNYAIGEWVRREVMRGRLSAPSRVSNVGM